MSKAQRAARKRKQARRILQAALPPENLQRPPRGDWSRAERRARQAMTDAHRAAGIAS